MDLPTLSRAGAPTATLKAVPRPPRQPLRPRPPLWPSRRPLVCVIYSMLQ